MITFYFLLYNPPTRMQNKIYVCDDIKIRVSVGVEVEHRKSELKWGLILLLLNQIKFIKEGGRENATFSLTLLISGETRFCSTL